MESTNIVVGKKDEIVMKILHYFVTEENYRPIIVNGVQNEIWLENLENDIPLIRININYIHNEEQLSIDLRKANAIRRSIKKKTYSIKMNVLNLLLDVRDEVKLIGDKNIETIKIDKITDLKKNKFINNFFPSLKDKIMTKKTGIIGMFEMTEQLNEKTTKEDKQLAKIFKGSRRPIVTYILLAINILIFFLSIIDYSFVINTFANYYKNLQNGEIWRLLTSTFVHADIFHILFNMMALMEIGPLIERYYGKTKYLAIYLGSGILGSLFSAVCGNYVSVGASGAIFGLFGAMVYFGYKYRATLDGFLRSGIIPVLIANLIIGILIPEIDIIAHIGGLLGGFLLSYTLGVANKENTKDKINGIILTIILVIALSYMLIIKWAKSNAYFNFE